MIASNGHISSFPDSLEELGLAFAIVKGRRQIREVGRKDLDAPRHAILEAARKTSGRIFIATDEDDEGDVIAWDICRQILVDNWSLAPSVFRLRPRALTPSGISRAIASAERLIVRPDDMALAAIPGRVRAAFDRWTGHALSEPGLPAGRVRSAVIGLCASGFRVETGEIVFRARSATGGPPFIARVALSAPAAPHLKRLADKVGTNFVPGTVRVMTTLHSAAAVRVGTPTPINTAQAIITAVRHHGLSSVRATAGLQSAYQAGMISYPRVSANEISSQSLGDTSIIAGHAGFGADFDPRPLSSVRVGRQSHEAIHPLLGGGATADRWRDLLNLSAQEPASDADRMASIVAKATIEAGMGRQLAPGSWDGPDEFKDLGELDWVQERGPRPTWSRNLDAGVRYWPFEAVIVDLMASNGLARPSTFAFHAEKLAHGGELEVPEAGEMPRPTPKGRAAIEGRAGDLAKPGMNAALEQIFGRLAAPSQSASIPEWISARLAEAWTLLSSETKSRLMEVLPTLEPEPPLPMPRRPGIAAAPVAHVRALRTQPVPAAPSPEEVQEIQPRPMEEQRHTAVVDRKPSIALAQSEPPRPAAPAQRPPEELEPATPAPEVFPSYYQSEEPGFF